MADVIKQLKNKVEPVVEPVERMNVEYSCSNVTQTVCFQQLRQSDKHKQFVMNRLSWISVSLKNQKFNRP